MDSTATELTHARNPGTLFVILFTAVLRTCVVAMIMDAPEVNPEMTLWDKKLVNSPACIAARAR